MRILHVIYTVKSSVKVTAFLRLIIYIYVLLNYPSFFPKSTAIASGLPFLNPYEKVDADFRHGVNFAVGGATALPVDVLTDRNILPSVTNSSLNVQLDWMSTYFNSLCHPGRSRIQILIT